MERAWLAQLPVTGLKMAIPVGGGDVNEAYQLKTSAADQFLLVQRHQPASFYAGEIAGLNAFAQADILAPRVLGNGQIAGDAYLLLTYLERGHGSQSDLGRLVAKLHSFRSPTGQFGFDTGYAGSSISFTNPWTASWAELYLGARLEPLAAQLTRRHAWTADDAAHFARVRAVIAEGLANHHSEPVLLHGDLWAGNYLFLADGRPALIDPAALYGDREFDLAMTTVFGGFSPAFYSAYNAALPLAPGHETRLNYYRLYYLMIHLDKFGTSYYGAVTNAMNEITG